MTSIAIIGSAISGNKGASAMLESAIETLDERLPDVQFTLLSMYPERDAALNTYPNLEIVAADPVRLGVGINSLALLHRLVPPLRRTIRRRSRAVAAIAEADVLLDQGGITFTDGREKFLLYNVASILPALNLKTPVFKCAQAIGPFRNPINRWAARTFLPKVRTIVTRGAITQRYADDLGLANTFAGADYAFSLELAGDERERLAGRMGLDALESERRLVGISPSVVMEKKFAAAGGDYVELMVAFARRLLEAGYDVLLLPHSARAGTEKTHNNDLPLCRRIAGQLGDGRVHFPDMELSSQELRYLIGRCAFFVTSRFHAMISSLSMGVPTLVIGWSHKYEEVLAMFELQEWAFGREKATDDYVWERFTDLVSAEDDVRTRLEQHLPDVKRVSLAQADLIADLVRSQG
ncbi:polysaccharide pyruvyl transferase family protein [Agromyces sp. GXS1127]|uniref:polysaccharide pyruvyl transferase family protein n=1 Tax=Agromyces sp. GXS1127 TaxID=3424181 RepID=UPI003D31AF41